MTTEHSPALIQQPEQPYLIVGLGNPGREYRANRHNIGFMVIEALAAAWAVRLNRVQHQAIVTTATFAARRVILARPQTFMNLSGQSVGALARFYKVPLPNLLVAHDDLDLPAFALRLRPTGGSGGQKGLASIIERLGTQDFPRIRCGIGRPPGRMDPSDYVLENFLPAEQPALNELLDRAVQAAQMFIELGLEPAMNRYNPAPAKDKE